MEQAKALFEQVINAIKNDYPDGQFISIFGENGNNFKIYKVQNGNIYLIVANSFDKFRIEKFYINHMNETLNTFTTEKMQFKLITEAAAEEEKAKAEREANPTTEDLLKLILAEMKNK